MQHLNTESLYFLMGFPSQKKWKKTHIYFQKIGISKDKFFVSSSKVRHRVQSEFWSGTLWVYRGKSRSKRCLKVTARWRDRTILFMPHTCLYFGRPLLSYVSLIYGSKDIGMNHEFLVYRINEKTDASDLHYMARSFWPGLQTFNLQHGSFQVQRWNQKGVNGSDCTSAEAYPPGIGSHIPDPIRHF